MGRYRFVDPETDRLPLSDGDWITVKKELNAGEQKAIFSGMVKEQRAGEDALLDPSRVGLSKLVQWIRAWSFADKEGKRVPLTESAINALDVDSYRELNDAVDAHAERSEAARLARKNGQGGEMTSSATSPSPGVAAGVSSGSVN